MTHCDQLCDASHKLTRPTHQGQVLDGCHPKLFQGSRSWTKCVIVAYLRWHSACARTSDASTSRNDPILATSFNWRIWVFFRWWFASRCKRQIWPTQVHGRSHWLLIPSILRLLSVVCRQRYWQVIYLLHQDRKVCFWKFQVSNDSVRADRQALQLAYHSPRSSWQSRLLSCLALHRQNSDLLSFHDLSTIQSAWYLARQDLLSSTWPEPCRVLGATESWLS